MLQMEPGTILPWFRLMEIVVPGWFCQFHSCLEQMELTSHFQLPYIVTKYHSKWKCYIGSMGSNGANGTGNTLETSSGHGKIVPFVKKRFLRFHSTLLYLNHPYLIRNIYLIYLCVYSRNMVIIYNFIYRKYWCFYFVEQWNLMEQKYATSLSGSLVPNVM